MDGCHWRRRPVPLRAAVEIVALRVSSPPPLPVIERLAEIVPANPRGHVEIEMWKENASRWPAEAFPEDSYLVTDLDSEDELIPRYKAEVLSSDGHVLRKLRTTGRGDPLQRLENAARQGIDTANDYATSQANRLVQQVAGKSLPRIPPEVVQGFIQVAKQLIEQRELHRFAEGDSVLINVDEPLISGEFICVHENGHAEIRIQVPMVDVRSGDRKGD